MPLERDPDLRERKCHFLTSIEVSSSQAKNKKKASLFHPILDVVRKRDHAHRLPDTEANTRSDTTIEAPDSVLLINKRKSVENRQFSGSVRIGSGLGH